MLPSVFSEFYCLEQGSPNYGPMADAAREALSSGPWRPFCVRKKITEIYVYPAKISRRLRGRYVFTELK